ncbi:hypothetical protein KVT40_007094 [Elsinoe batatas]|uniref:Uncharacterized protein n=1 Tax=Elsinoe batatas TaxID=2601811 RepID=A0A8K0L3Y8_9PEZI|nr:hypothetical protein KVT40_007094 [Elsinoe batatas]
MHTHNLHSRFSLEQSLSTHVMPLLPLEIVDMIVEHCHDIDSTIQLAQTCRTYHRMLMPIVYHTIEIVNRIPGVSILGSTTSLDNPTSMSWVGMTSFIRAAMNTTATVELITALSVPAMMCDPAASEAQQSLREAKVLPHVEAKDFMVPLLADQIIKRAFPSDNIHTQMGYFGTCFNSGDGWLALLLSQLKNLEVLDLTLAGTNGYRYSNDWEDTRFWALMMMLTASPSEDVSRESFPHHLPQSLLAVEPSATLQASPWMQEVCDVLSGISCSTSYDTSHRTCTSLKSLVVRDLKFVMRAAPAIDFCGLCRLELHGCSESNDAELSTFSNVLAPLKTLIISSARQRILNGQRHIPWSSGISSRHIQQALCNFRHTLENLTIYGYDHHSTLRDTRTVTFRHLSKLRRLHVTPGYLPMDENGLRRNLDAELPHSLAELWVLRLDGEQRTILPAVLSDRMTLPHLNTVILDIHRSHADMFDYQRYAELGRDRNVKVAIWKLHCHRRSCWNQAIPGHQDTVFRCNMDSDQIRDPMAWEDPRVQYTIAAAWPEYSVREWKNKQLYYM